MQDAAPRIRRTSIATRGLQGLQPCRVYGSFSFFKRYSGAECCVRFTCTNIGDRQEHAPHVRPRSELGLRMVHMYEHSWEAGRCPCMSSHVQTRGRAWPVYAPHARTQLAGSSCPAGTKCTVHFARAHGVCSTGSTRSVCSAWSTYSACGAYSARSTCSACSARTTCIPCITRSAYSA